MAWLDAAPIPETPHNPRIKKPTPQQRRKTLTVIHQPEIKPRSHIMVGYLMGLLAAQQSSSEISPITFSEIESWCRLTGTELSPDSVEFLQRLSVLYVSQLNASSDPKCPAPYKPVKMSDNERQQVASKVKGFFASMKG